MNKINLEDLSPEALADLAEQLKAKQEAEKKADKQNKEALATMENDFVLEVYDEAKPISDSLMAFKRWVVEKAGPLNDMKIAHGKAAPDQDQYTHKSFDGKRVVVRYNRTTRYDDGIQAAISYAKQWMQDQIDDEKSKRLVGLIDRLLSKDQKGNYSPSNLLQFVRHAREMNDPLIQQAAEAIEQSIYEDSTSISVLIFHKDDLGVELRLPMSIVKA